MSNDCQLVNTYQVLEHVMGIHGLHPHRLDTVRAMRRKLARHLADRPALCDGVVLDIGCGSGAGTAELATLLGARRPVVGIDINGQAIGTARRLHADVPNLAFHHGDLDRFVAGHPALPIAGAICISTSMFIADLAGFYRRLHATLLDGGIFIDAPFMFRGTRHALSDAFRRRTYGVCGCDMNMFEAHQLQALLLDAGFASVESVEHAFDLMKLPVLFQDYPAPYLVRNFLRNVASPPAGIGKVSSRYLLARTLAIFRFFLRYRSRYASGEFVAVKRLA